jgi:hypothetical protein
MNDNTTDTNNEKSQKKVAYYSALVNAWIQTKMEVDKTLIIISSAGIGFLITIISKLDINNVTELIIYLSAFISFFIVIITCVEVFRKNAVYIKNIIDEKDDNHKSLDTYSFVAKLFFTLALIFILILGINIGVKQLKKGGMEMEEKKGKLVTNEGLGGLHKLKPEVTVKKGLGGLGDLSPDRTDSSGNTGTTSNTTQDSGSDSK